MSIDPELLKQLIASFQSELDEHTLEITNNLIKLEKGEMDEHERSVTIETIFRAAHNIKGTARSIGINNVAEIAHRIESLFASIQKNTITITPSLIDLCLQAVDKMNAAMHAFVTKSTLPFVLNDFLTELDNVSAFKSEPTSVKEAVSEPQIVRPREIPSSPSETVVPYPKQNEMESIRVGIKKIDKVSALMEEMQVNKIAIEDHYSEMQSLATKTQHFSHIWQQILFTIKQQLGKSMGENLQKAFHTGNDYFSEMFFMTQGLHKNMRNQVNELSTLSNSLQEEIRMMRLVPASNLLETLHRHVRDLAQELNKKVELTIHGGDVKLDKLVLEGLKNPIIHLLRNAIDHGIETPEVRRKKGKPEMGLIKINVVDENNQIFITLSDDGAGIDSKKVIENAIKNNIISKDEINHLSETEVLDLIFLPGFSTKETVTDVSGRGVGLDVVKANLSDLKGHVYVKTEVGKGTIFSLRVPLTLSSERGLLITCEEQNYVIPSHAIERILTIPTKNIQQVEGTQTISLDKKTIPLCSLADVLGIEKKFEPTNRLSLVVIKKGWQMVALLVDDIVGEKEIVIKPLRSPLSHVPCISGGTLLERSRVVCVLNPTDLINLSLNIKVTTTFKQIVEIDQTVARTKILIVDDSITTRTLEKNILEAKNYDVTVAVNGKEAWDILQKHPFSLLITDVTMPVMDGFTLTKQVKHSENLKNMPVIIVTSLGSEAEKTKGMESGADAYIVKSEFESGALIDIVKQLV